MARRRILTWRVLLCAVVPATFAGTAAAAKWDIVPTLSSDVTYTDNVRLAPSGSERSDWVTQVTPGISVSGTGAGLRVSAAYGAQILERARSHSGGISHQFNGTGNAELVKQLLFIDASASVGQQNISLLGPQTNNNINDTGNRTTVRTFLVSPYLRRSFGQSAQGELRLTHSAVGTDSAGGLATSRANRVNMQVSSGPAFRLYTWNVAYSTENVDSAQQPGVTTEKFTAGGRRLVTSQVALTSSVGYEKSDFATAGSAPSGAFWNVGFEWTPTPRTRVAASSGKRYFGDSRAFDFSHRTRLTTWSAAYSEDVTTTHAQALIPSSVATTSIIDPLFLSSVPDPVARQQAVKDFIALNALPASLTVPLNVLTTQTILLKRWQASAAVNGARNTVLANVFAQTSESVTAGLPASGVGDFASSSSVKQTGASVAWNLRIATRTAANFGASYTVSEFPALGRKDDVQSIGLSVSHQFQRKLSGSLSYRGLRNESSQAGAGQTENAVTAALNATF